MWRRACLAAPMLLLAACGSEQGLPVPTRPGADTLVRRPAQHLALVLADLPAGFDVGEELVSVTPTGGSAPPDPFGRLSAYAITFRAPGNRGRTADVVSSVNAYVGLAEARANFDAWQAAVPNTYRRLVTPPPGAPPGAVAYLQATEGACLLGFRSRNIVASVRVGSLPGEPLGAAGAPEQTVRLASLVLHRIDAVAGR
jgi:hypothetical protein